MRTHHILHWRFTAGIISLLALIAMTLAVHAQIAPINVTLASFDVTPLDNAVRLGWTTDTELDLAGFFLRREHNGDLVDLDNIGIVPGEGGTVFGADYEVVDNTAVNYNTYTYKLYELETDGDEIELDSETVTLSGPTATPIVIGGSNPTNTPVPQNSNTSTPTPTRTQSSNTATPTPIATTSGTRIPSPTPLKEDVTPLSTAVSTPQPTSTRFPTPTPGDTSNQSGTQPIQLTTEETSPTATPDPLNLPPMLATPDNHITVGVPVAYAQEGYAAPPTPSPIPIGSDRAYIPPIQTIATPPPAVQSEPAGAEEGRMLLWTGFLLALLLFVGSVVGSILLFTRKQDRSNN